MGRLIGAMVLGIVVAFATVALVEYLQTLVFPAPAAIDWNDKAALAALVDALPIAAKLTIATSWFLGALLGALTTASIARRSAIGWVPALLVLAGGIANLLMIPHPAWMIAAALVLPLLGGWLGARLATRRHA